MTSPELLFGPVARRRASSIAKNLFTCFSPLPFHFVCVNHMKPFLACVATPCLMERLMLLAVESMDTQWD